MWPLLLPLIGTGVKAVADIFAGRTQAKAAKEAAAQQQAGVREARAYIEPIYAKAQAGLAPYAQQGAAGLTALSALMGIPQAPAAAPAPNTASFAAPAQPTVPFASLTGTARGNAVADANRRQFGAYYGANQVTPMQAVPTMVRLRAPTGEEREVPHDQVNQYLALGATRI